MDCSIECHLALRVGQIILEVVERLNEEIDVFQVPPVFLGFGDLRFLRHPFRDVASAPLESEPFLAVLQVVAPSCRLTFALAE